MKKILLILALLACSPVFAALRGTAGQANATTSNSITVTVSGISIQANDIVLVCISGDAGSGNTFTYPSGFSAVPGLSNLALGGSTGTMGVAYKVATGSEPSSYTITYSQTDFISVQVRVYSGRNTSSPFTAVNSTTSAGGTSPITYALPGVTAATGDDVVTCVGNQYYDGATPSYTQASGFANPLLSYSATQYSPIMSSADYANHAAGATGTIAGTFTNADGDTQYYGGYVISLAAASGTAAPTNGGFSTIAKNIP